MEAVKLREKLIQEIGSADENLLKVIDDVIENYNNTLHADSVAEPSGIIEYNKEIDAAEDAIAKGDVYTRDEVSEMIKQWG